MRRTLGLWFSSSLFGVGCSPNADMALQCTETGGEWREVSECPSACAPPAPTAEACATIDDQVCAAVCGDVPLCHCPADTPFWEEGVGCVGFEACPDGAS